MAHRGEQPAVVKSELSKTRSEGKRQLQNPSHNPPKTQPILNPLYILNEFLSMIVAESNAMILASNETEFNSVQTNFWVHNLLANSHINLC